MSSDKYQRETILVIEDDAGIAELEQMQLERAGFTVVTAGTSEEALGQLRRHHVDLLLLDYRLPGDLDGLDVYLECKAMGFELPVILVTGFSNEAVAIRALRAGVRDLITKSAEYLDYLPEAVERVLRQVRTERQLAESEARLTSIIDSANDAIIIAETGLQITLFNQAAEAMFRCPASNALGQPVSRFIPQEYPLEPERKSDDSQPAREPLIGLSSYANRGVRMDGTEFPLERSVSRTDVGGRSFYTVIVRDITERKRAEVLLRQSVERFRILAESMPLVIFTAQPNGTVDYYNQHWAEFTGLPTGSIENLNWAQFVHPGDLEETNRQWRHSVETGAPFQLEHRFRRSDGDSRWHLSRANALRDAGGNVLIWTGSSTDIDDQKCSENALKEADKRKNEFLAILAHELRNPLAALSCGLSLVTGASHESDRNWALTMAEHQVRLLTRLVDDLLDTSRITRGTFQLRVERVRPAELIERAVATVRHLAEAQGHHLLLAMAPELPQLEADPARLEQVICNLLTNAVKFTPQDGRIELSVGTEGGDLVLTVRDTGIGIAPDFLPHVFDSFAQVDKSLVRERGGLGIGLTLVKAIVELHGGSVEARSDGFHRGSEVIVRLPTIGADDAVGSGPRSVEDRPIRDADRGIVRRRILMVEDNQDYALGVRRMLGSAGHEVQICNDGLVALSQAKAFAPDVVLLDLGLPGMDGYEVARRMREDESLARAKIIVLSGYASEEDRRRSTQVGVDEHLTKPVRFSELLRVVELNRLAVG